MREQVRPMIYDMCRGGGFAYELLPEYVEQRKNQCAQEAETMLLELPKRMDQLHPANQSANVDPTDFMARLSTGFYVDYCIKKDHERRGAVTAGECAYIDNRAVSNVWAAIFKGSELNAVSIFKMHFFLPAPFKTVINKLQQSGFTCKEQISCELYEPFVVYKDNKLEGFGGSRIIYKFETNDGNITAVTATRLRDTSF